MIGRHWKLSAGCAALLAAQTALAVAETGTTSSWSTRTKPGSVTRPSGARPAARRSAKSKGKAKQNPGLRSTITTVPEAAGKPLKESTLGPIMAEPSGDDAAYIAFDQGQYLTALRLAEAGAERDEPQALTLMGRIYERGLGVPVDTLKAAQLYRRGAELGEAVYAEDGVQPMRDEDTRPFAGLAALRGQLKDED